MINMLVLYPRTEGNTFDADYWVNTHMPLAAGAWGSHLAKWEAHVGAEGQPFFAMANFYFADEAAMQAAMGSAGTAGVMADVANYTNMAPQMQLGAVASNG